MQILNNNGITGDIITQIVISTMILLIGIFVSKSFLTLRKWDYSSKSSIVLNGLWFGLNLIGIFISSFITLDLITTDIFIVNIIDIVVLLLNILVGILVIKGYYDESFSQSIIFIIIFQCHKYECYRWEYSNKESNG